MQISYFCLNVHPLILAFLLDFACSKLLLCYPDGDFLFLSCLLHSLIGIFLEGRLPLPFIYLFTWLFIYIRWTREYSFRSLNLNPILLLFNLLFKLFQLWSQEVLWGWPLEPSKTPLWFCLSDNVFTFWQGMLWVIFCFPVWGLESTFDYFLMNRCNVLFAEMCHYLMDIWTYFQSFPLIIF